jgi:hypothetical protein
MPREARLSSAGPVTNARGVARREDAGEKAPTMGEVSSRIARRHFAERFERGELNSRPPEVRTRTPRILPDDRAIATSRTLPWLLSGLGDVGVGVFPEGEEVRLWLSGRRRRACALASVRRSNCTCGFPACSFHEDSYFRDVIEGINRTRFTNPYSPYSLVSGSCCQPLLRQRLHRCDRMRCTIQPLSLLKSFRTWARL